MPLIRVAAVVLKDDAERVLTVRKRGTERFMLPGGKPESGEIFRQTARREVSEELGLDLLDDELVPLACFFSAAANEPGHELESHVFRYGLPIFEMPQARAEIEEVRWFSEEELRYPNPDLLLAPMLEFDAAPAIFGWPQGQQSTRVGEARAAYMTLHELVHSHSPLRGDRALSVAQYEKARLAYLAERGDTSKSGVAVWPPTSQTVMKQLGDGSWASAMQSMGLVTAAGRARGALRYDEAAYVETVASFLAAVSSAESPEATSDSFAQFTAWLAREKALGRQLPSAASVRQHFKGWDAAKHAGRREKTS